MSPVTNLQEFVEGYQLYCQAEGKRPKTITWYTQKLRYFLHYLEQHELPTDVGEITIHHLRSFLVHLQTEVKSHENNPIRPATGKPLSPLTIRGYARTIKTFFSWLDREGYVENNPTSQGAQGGQDNRADLQR